jgi:hypothetical protein
VVIPDGAVSAWVPADIRRPDFGMLKKVLLLTVDEGVNLERLVNNRLLRVSSSGVSSSCSM